MEISVSESRRVYRVFGYFAHPSVVFVAITAIKVSSATHQSPEQSKTWKPSKHGLIKARAFANEMVMTYAICCSNSFDA